MIFCGAMTKRVRHCKRAARYACLGCRRPLCHQHAQTVPDETGWTNFYCWVCVLDAKEGR